MLLTAYTFFHVVISLLGLFSGLVVFWGLLNGKRMDGWTAFFLTTTVLTSVTGFFFPVHRFMPSHAVGILSLLVLAVAIYARYPRRMAGRWRKVYVVSALIALYLNLFVGIVQSFEKIPPLKALAPTQSETPFKVTQGIVLTIFVLLTVVAALKFREQPINTPAQIDSDSP